MTAPKVVPKMPKPQKVDMGYEWSVRMEHAQVRCAHEAKSEEVLGYEDNAKAYTEMAEEMTHLKWWVLGILGVNGFGAI